MNKGYKKKKSILKRQKLSSIYNQKIGFPFVAECNCRISIGCSFEGRFPDSAACRSPPPPPVRVSATTVLYCYTIPTIIGRSVMGMGLRLGLGAGDLLVWAVVFFSLSECLTRCVSPFFFPTCLFCYTVRKCRARRRVSLACQWGAL